VLGAIVAVLLIGAVAVAIGIGIGIVIAPRVGRLFDRADATEREVEEPRDRAE
jgi:Na+/H+-dicarboxylate symporter